jgi:acetyltransferase-like isoleucine patch superfamily enzyme
MALLRHPASDGKFVDDRFSALVEPNLFDNNVFQPGITFTDKYTLGAAGQIFIHKLGKVTVTVGEPGQDFSDTNTADQTIAITLNKAFRRSEKIYGATAAAVAYPIAAAHLEQALADIRESWNREAAKTIIAEKYNFANGSVVGPGSVLGSGTALAANNIYKSIVDDRAVLVAAKARPDALIVSPATYALLLQSEEFVRASDLAYETAASGQVGQVAGLRVFEYSGFETFTMTVSGTPDDFLPEYIMFDHDAFSIVTNVEVLRLVDSERFNGTLAQVEIVSGMKLTNTDRALVKIKEA